MESIESTELRGVSLRTLITIISATILIVSTVLVTTSKIGRGQDGLKNDIVLLRVESDANQKINDMKLETLERRLVILEEAVKNVIKK